MNRRSFLSFLAVAAFVPNALLTAVAKAKVARKPLFFGRVLNVAAVELDPDKLTYQIHDGPVSQIDAVRDGGIAIVIDGDDANITELCRATILPGHARTCVACGAIRLGSPPVFPLTVDAVGEGMRSRVTRMDELCGAVRYGDSCRAWRDEIDAQGILVHTWDHSEAGRILLNKFEGVS